MGKKLTPEQVAEMTGGAISAKQAANMEAAAKAAPSRSNPNFDRLAPSSTGDRDKSPEQKGELTTLFKASAEVIPNSQYKGAEAAMQNARQQYQDSIDARIEKGMNGSAPPPPGSSGP